jgi:hypothetical protein
MSSLIIGTGTESAFGARMPNMGEISSSSSSTQRRKNC